MPNDKVNILIADDHSLVAGGYQLLLATDHRFNVIETLTSGRQVMDFLETKSCDVLILDLHMPNGDGLEVIDHIKLRGLNIKIVVVSMLASPILMKKVLEQGVDGYVYKTSKPDTLLKALYKVLNGETYFEKEDQGSKNPLHSHSFNVGNKRILISSRELEIIKLISQGRSSKDIADKLFISEHTVMTHRKNINQKLNVHNTAELVSLAIRHNIVSLI